MQYCAYLSVAYTKEVGGEKRGNWIEAVPNELIAFQRQTEI